MTNQEQGVSKTEDLNDDATVCYCYRLSTKTLKTKYKEYGSLKVLQEQTKAGMACGGCRIILHSMFSEVPSDPSDKIDYQSSGSLCVKPGNLTQKGFIVSDHNLESKVYASNAVAPQLGDCDSTVVVDYKLINQDGIPVHIGNETIPSNKTFELDTKLLDLPKPFYGMLLLKFNRSNLGAGRFNIYWHGKNSYTSTHETGVTGRYNAFVPFLVDKKFLEGPNTVYYGVNNTYGHVNPYEVIVYNPNGNESIKWISSLNPYSTEWLNLNELFFKKADKLYPGKKWALKLTMNKKDPHGYLNIYFFLHNKQTDIWSSNHL